MAGTPSYSSSKQLLLASPWPPLPLHEELCNTSVLPPTPPLAASILSTPTPHSFPNTLSAVLSQAGPLHLLLLPPEILSKNPSQSPSNTSPRPLSRSEVSLPNCSLFGACLPIRMSAPGARGSSWARVGARFMPAEDVEWKLDTLSSQVRKRNPRPKSTKHLT